MNETTWRPHVVRRYRPKRNLVEHLVRYHDPQLVPPWKPTVADLDRIHRNDHATVAGESG